MNISKILSEIIDFCISPKRRWLWITIFLFSLMGMADIPDANIYKVSIPIWFRWVCIGFSSAFKASLLMILVAVCRKNNILRILSVATVCIYAFLSFVNFICYEFYGFGISHKMLMLMSQTNQEETAEFFGSFGRTMFESLSPTLALYVVIILMLYVLLQKLPRKIFLIISILFSSIGCVSYAFLIFSTFHGKNAYSIFARSVKNIKEVAAENRRINELIDKMQPYSHADSVTSSHDAFNMVVIFGESADRSHLSLYGYPLSTSPMLDAKADSLVIFSDALASSKFTADNMERMLTLKSDRQSDGWWHYPMLIDILNAAGYRTFWLSNQEQTGIYSNGTSVMSSRADVCKYVGKTSSEDPLLQKYDEVLIPELVNALSDTLQPKWIGLHLYGSHVSYKNRYPESRQYFSGDDIKKARPRKWMTDDKYEVAANYDSSIRYTDSVVGKMFDIVAQQEKPSVVIYLSDHGEDVYDNRDHNGRDIKNVRVPFVLYANQAFRNEYPNLMETVLNARGRRFTTANLPYAVMTLTGTVCPDYNPEADFLSTEFKECVRYVENEPWPYE